MAEVAGMNPNKQITSANNFAKDHPEWESAYIAYGENTGVIYPGHATQNGTAILCSSKYPEAYISEADIARMAEMGYNSIRVPISARLFLEDGPRLRFREEGFLLLDALLDACEKHGLYAFIDLHAAPGGQTGANIDDSLDDLCRLFIDEAQFERGFALWEELARRYKDRWIVGGYDLLNEPIRPVRFEGDPNLDGYEPRLRAFYEEAIRRIRRHDRRHVVALEGMHWATDNGIFDHVYDDNMVLQFHRYGCPPDIDSLRDSLSAPLS